ncbi:MAG: hypothetical protein WA707_22970 [Pseudolabrys sp.]
MPPMPPPGIAGAPWFYFGTSATIASVVISRPATDAAPWIAERTTLVGSMMNSDRQDVNSLHRRNDPVRDLDGLAERRLVDPHPNRIECLGKRGVHISGSRPSVYQSHNQPRAW